MNASEYYDLGIKNFYEDHYRESVENFTKVLKLAPLASITYCFRGLCYGYLSEHDNALADFNKAIELNDSYLSIAYSKRGIYYARIKQFKRAIADFTKAIEIEPNEGFYYRWRGMCFNILGQDINAFSDFNKAIKLTPDDDCAYSWRGLYYQKKEEYDKAILDYKKALELGDKDAEAGIKSCLEKQKEQAQLLTNN